MREDVRAARELARAEIGATLALPLLIGFLWVAAPGGFGPMFDEPPWYVDALPWIAWAVYLIGLAWMIRIYRTSHLEPEPDCWRYRS